MTFTVLQHMTDDAARTVLEQVKRIVRPEDHVLLVEKTDPASLVGDPQNGSRFLSQGRGVGTFAAWMAPHRLLQHFPRQVAPTNPGASNVGSYMLFRGPG